MKKLNICPICKQESDMKYSHIQTIQGFQRHSCTHCAAIYITPQNFPMPKYDTEYNEFFKRPSDIYKAGLYAKKIAEDMGYPDIEKSFIDIGSGSAILPWLLKQMGYKAFVLENDARYCAKIVRDFDIYTYCFNVEEWKNKTKFDYIHCSHVIEHSKDPLMFLCKLKNMMHEDSTLLISTPDTFYYGDKDISWKHLHTRNPFEHCTLMSRISMEILINSLNLKIKSFKRFEEFQSMEFELTL